MDFMEISRKRKTVRRFSQTPVEQEKLEKILEAGRWSPTAVNLQPQMILCRTQVLAVIASRCLKPAFIMNCRKRLMIDLFRPERIRL